MENTSFMRVEEVAQELGISKSYAYKIVQKLNEKLNAKGQTLCPQWDWVFSLPVGMLIAMLPGVCGNLPFANALSCVWSAFGNL